MDSWLLDLLEPLLLGAINRFSSGTNKNFFKDTEYIQTKEYWSVLADQASPVTLPIFGDER